METVAAIVYGAGLCADRLQASVAPTGSIAVLPSSIKVILPSELITKVARLATPASLFSTPYAVETSRFAKSLKNGTEMLFFKANSRCDGRLSVLMPKTFAPVESNLAIPAWYA
jgi:hypothetical protein